MFDLALAHTSLRLSAAKMIFRQDNLYAYMRYLRIDGQIWIASFFEKVSQGDKNENENVLFNLK